VGVNIGLSHDGKNNLILDTETRKLKLCRCVRSLVTREGTCQPVLDWRGHAFKPEIHFREVKTRKKCPGFEGL
jgi:hypothetical protein